MEATENLELLSVLELIDRFEKDVRFGCSSTITDAGRSAAGRELEKRPKKDTVPLLYSRWKAMNEQQTLDGVEKSVRSAITMLIQWIEQEQ